jgi:hypothetical protein
VGEAFGFVLGKRSFRVTLALSSGDVRALSKKGFTDWTKTDRLGLRGRKRRILNGVVEHLYGRVIGLALLRVYVCFLIFDVFMQGVKACELYTITLKST